RGAHGWEATLPAGDRDTVRLVARATLPVTGARLFTARWPIIPAHTAGDPASIRRVCLVPRHALARAPADWTCEDDGTSEIPCVSTVSNPEPLTLSFRGAPSPRGALPVVLAGVVLVVAALARFGPAARRFDRAVGAVAGTVAGAAIALAMVGALWTHWALALGACIPPLAALGAFATRTRRATSIAGLALLVLPLVSVIDGRPWRALGAAAVFAVGVVLTAWRAAPAATSTPEEETPPPPRESSPAPPPGSSPSP
ncbi:MAG: hypothetical protein WCJ30_11465, partial [Deltaproteobacteria bacterium]